MCDGECRLLNEAIGNQRKASKFHVLTPEYISYYETAQGRWLRGLVVFTPGTTVTFTGGILGHHSNRTSLTLNTQVRKFVMVAQDRSSAERWRRKIQMAIAKGKMTHSARFDAFCPIRPSNMVSWLVGDIDLSSILSFNPSPNSHQVAMTHFEPLIWQLGQLGSASLFKVGSSPLRCFYRGIYLERMRLYYKPWPRRQPEESRFES